MQRSKRTEKRKTSEEALNNHNRESPGFVPVVWIVRVMEGRR